MDIEEAAAHNSATGYLRQVFLKNLCQIILKNYRPMEKSFPQGNG